MTIRALFFSTSVILLLPHFFVSAAVANSVSISPAKIELAAVPGELSRASIIVTNSLEQTAHITISSEDVTGTTDGSDPIKLLGTETGDFSLKDFLKAPIREFDLAPGEQRVVPITVVLPENSSPGGRYGAVVFSISTLDAGKPVQTGSGATVHTRLAATFFVKTPGVVREESITKTFDTTSGDRLFFSTPIRFFASVENMGTVHLNTYGVLSIENIFGKTVFQNQIPPTYILPASTRTIFMEWPGSARFGYYSVKLTLNRGYGDIVDQFMFPLFVFSWGIVVVLLITIPVIAVLVRQYRFSRRLQKL